MAYTYLLEQLETHMAMPSLQPITVEISPVDREYPPRSQRFSGDDQGRIGQIHGMIGGLLHQFKGARHRRFGEEPNIDPLLQDKISQSVGTHTRRRQHVKRLGKHRDSGIERASDPLQDPPATRMRIVLRVE